MSEISKIIFINILLYTSTEAQELWKEVDTLNHVVTFYDKTGENYDTAKTFCSNLPGETQIVQLDDTFVRDAVYETIADARRTDYFWIGAERDTSFDCPNASNCKWNWVNGSSVDMSMIIWYECQPDNDGGNENRMVIRGSDNKFGDVKVNSNFAGSICQKRRDTPRYQLTFYDQAASSWNDAVETCSDIGATLVQLDDDDVREEVYAAIGSAVNVNYFWIGATGACYDWTWLDGTPVTINLSWYENQPDNYKIEENILLIRTRDIKFGDIRENFNDSGIICQKRRSCADNTDLCIHGTCVPGSSTCDCEPGYYGHRCQTCKEDSNLCVHGDCNVDGVCVCLSGYYGDRCQDCHEDSDLCVRGTCEEVTSFFNIDEFDCSNGSCDRFTETLRGTGNCDALPPPKKNYKCICDDTGYYGDTCEFDYCGFHPNTCKNGGECTSTPDHEPFYKCNCTGTGYDGDLCDFAYGKPTIESVEPTLCSADGILTVKWQPDNQTTSVVHRFEVESLNSTTQVKKIKYETYKSNSHVIFDNLDPSTAYKILVEVCPDQCITKLGDVRTQTTGIGLPEKVQAFYVGKNEDSQHCIVTWDWPESPNDQIIDYEIFVEAELMYTPADLETENIVDKMVTTVKSPGLVYTHESEPNTDYTFYITARSCAGSGETVKATGSCITKTNAPNQVPKPIISMPSKASSIREITIPLADETNGPISCSFVIVHRGDFIHTNRSFDIEQLEDASNAALSDNSGVDYLAIAIPREYMTSKFYTTNLGDSRTTNCDVSKILTARKRK